MDQLQEAHIKSCCESVILKFALLNDSRQYEALSKLFAADGVFLRPLSPDTPIRGRDAITADLSRKPPEMRSVHVCTNMLVDVIDSRSAKASSYFTVYLQHEGAAGNAVVRFNGTIYVGCYEDTFVLENGAWLIERRQGRNWFELPMG